LWGARQVLFFGFDPDREMKMVSQQTIRVCVGDGLDMSSIQRKKVRVISFFEKKVFLIIAAIVDVIVHAGN
jgi:hypothetical protein